jgi:hypothetical protein
MQENLIFPNNFSNNLERYITQYLDTMHPDNNRRFPFVNVVSDPERFMFYLPNQNIIFTVNQDLYVIQINLTDDNSIPIDQYSQIHNHVKQELIRQELVLDHDINSQEFIVMQNIQSLQSREQYTMNHIRRQRQQNNARQDNQQNIQPIYPRVIQNAFPKKLMTIANRSDANISSFIEKNYNQMKGDESFSKKREMIEAQQNDSCSDQTISLFWQMVSAYKHHNENIEKMSFQDLVNSYRDDFIDDTLRKFTREKYGNHEEVETYLKLRTILKDLYQNT